MSQLCVVWSSFAVLVVSFGTYVSLPVFFCPVPTCECDGSTIDCSGNNWTSFTPITLSHVLGDEYTEIYYNAVENLYLQGNDIQILPDVLVVLDFMPKLSRLYLADNPSLNCSHVDTYREYVEVIADQCPYPDESSTEAPEPNQANPAMPSSIVNTSQENRVPQPIQAFDRSPPPSSAQEESSALAWTVIFLNCCFVGISGMVIGCLLAVILPPVFRVLGRTLNCCAKVPDDAVKEATKANLYHIPSTKSTSGGYTSSEKSGKRIIRLDF